MTSMFGPRVSVIMSTFREVSDGLVRDATDSTLGRAIQSVLRQTFTDWELFVVSDHPPERDRKALIRLMSAFDGDDRITYADLPERSGFDGIGIAPKALALKSASGELLAFLDADNEWAPDHLEHSIKALERRPMADLVYCNSLVRLSAQRWGSSQIEQMLEAALFGWNELGPIRGDSFRWIKPDWGIEARMRLDRYNYIDMSEPVIRTRSFRRSGGFTSNIKTDWDLWRSLLNQGIDRFVHSAHTGLILRSASLKQHRELFMLSQIERFGIPFDMTDHEKGRVEERRRAYLEKHGL